MEFKEKLRNRFKVEKGFTYWAEGVDFGSFNDNYVNWLEQEIKKAFEAGRIAGCTIEKKEIDFDDYVESLNER